MQHIFSLALPSRPYSLIGGREEKRWELRRRNQHENLEIYPAMKTRDTHSPFLFNGTTHGFFHIQHLSSK